MALFEDKALNRRFMRGQYRMLVMTIIGYTLFYFLRKNLSLAMPGLAQERKRVRAKEGLVRRAKLG